MKKILINTIFTSLIIGASSCNKLVEVTSPVTSFDGSKIYSKDGNAIAVLTSIYQDLSGDGLLQGTGSVSMFGGLLADELMDYRFSTQKTAAYQNQMLPSNVPMWNRIYYIIYTANSALEGVEKSSTLSPAIKQQLLGEARFVRALLYYYLVNFWGAVPLNLTTDYELNAFSKRASKEIVLNHIIKDLEEASGMLSEEFLLSDLRTISTERIRPSKWAALALLSRTYLYAGNYSKAEEISSRLINETTRFGLQPLNQVFLTGSKEAIWQIQPISPTWTTFDAKAFVLVGTPNFDKPASLSEHLLNAFEAGDKRRTDWVKSITVGTTTYYFPFKYQVYQESAPHTEALTVFRLAEQFLIRAEARSYLNKVADGVSDVNEIRRRARALPTVVTPDPLPELDATVSPDQLRTLILNERRIELFTEQAHRWFDLKRTNTIDAVMSIITPQKGGTWKSEKALLPLPGSEIIRNYNMTQNPGY